MPAVFEARARRACCSFTSTSTSISDAPFVLLFKVVTLGCSSSCRALVCSQIFLLPAVRPISRALRKTPCTQQRHLQSHQMRSQRKQRLPWPNNTLPLIGRPTRAMETILRQHRPSKTPLQKAPTARYEYHLPLSISTFIIADFH